MNEQVKISLIAAMDEIRVIGYENKLPWKLPADMKWFRKNTLGKAVVMGRKTFESLGSKPLPDRTNIIVSHNVSFTAENCYVATSLAEAVKIAQQPYCAELMIIGGATFYQYALPYVSRMYLTIIHHNFLGDSWFPKFIPSEWNLVSRQDFDPDEKNQYRYSFIVYDRKVPPLDYKQ